MDNSGIGQLISVVIPTCNRNELLDKCLRSLAPGAQTFSDERYEVIVTDDSRENSAKLLIEEKYPWVKLVEGPKKGPAANRNNGAKYASGSWLVFTDDDCLPDSRWLCEYNKAIEYYPDCLAFEGAINPDDAKLLLRDMAECPVNSSGGAFWSANICIQRELFEMAQGFDENIRIAAHEDQDLYLRLLRLTSIRFLVNANIIHPVRIRSLGSKLSDITVTLQNWIYFSSKYNSISTSIKQGLWSQIVGLFQNIRNGKLRLSFYHLITLLFFFPVLLGHYMKRHFNQRDARTTKSPYKYGL